REETIDFSDPYYDAGTAILVREDEEEIKTKEDLAGKVVATKQGTSSYDYVIEMDEIKEVIPFPNIDQAYMELHKGTADAVVFDLPSVLYYVNTSAQGQAKVLDDLLEGQTFGIAFPKGSPLKNEVNIALANIKENGTYDELHEKWFGEAATEKAAKSGSFLAVMSDALPTLMQGVKYTIFISVLGLLIGFAIGIVVGFGR